MPHQICSKEKGFTLIELLIVIAIIGILAGVVLVQLSSTRDRARTSRAQDDLRSLNTAIEMLVNDTELLPGRLDARQCVYQVADNEVFLNAEAGGIVGLGSGFPDWQGPYATYNIQDSWGRTYWFDSDYDCSQGTPIGCENQPQWIQAIVSSGSNGSGLDVYDADNIVLVRCRE